MVQWQICTLEHLMNSGFGRPFPRHGLQLLFWFSNHCVTCELADFVDIMKLVSDCQPERGFYGFHLFGNMEELLPVLNRPKKRKSKTQIAYYEVGNLNTETYPASANLPAYVRENYGLDGNYSNYNIDRIIISYQARSRVVETVYVTEHDGAALGRFRPDRTYEISCELIRSLQSTQLDLTTFLTQMGYYEDLQTAQDIEEMHYMPASAQQVFDVMQTWRGAAARTVISDELQFFSEAFNQQRDVNINLFSCDQQVHYSVNTPPQNYGLVATYSEVPKKSRKPKANKRSRALRHNYWPTQPRYWPSWEQSYTAFDEEAKKRDGGGAGLSFFKILLKAGALYLALKCFSWWLRSGSKVDLKESFLKMIPQRTPSYPRTHIMLDYVY